MITVDQIQSISLTGITAIGVVMGLTQVGKKYVTDKNTQLMAVVLGLLISFLFNGFSALSVVGGLMYGLAATGIYDIKNENVSPIITGRSSDGSTM